jgi:hypothetical protein
MLELIHERLFYLNQIDIVMIPCSISNGEALCIWGLHFCCFFSLLIYKKHVHLSISTLLEIMSIFFLYISHLHINRQLSCVHRLSMKYIHNDSMIAAHYKVKISNWRTIRVQDSSSPSIKCSWQVSCEVMRVYRILAYGNMWQADFRCVLLHCLFAFFSYGK